jgi:hypothetical protein
MCLLTLPACHKVRRLDVGDAILSFHNRIRPVVTKDPSKIKRCPECRRLVEASTMRPLSRTRFGGGVRYACPDCFKRVMALRKAVASARNK